MNRRNFLKLLGIGLLPVPVLAAPTVESTVETVEEHTDWLILETPYMGMHTVELDEPGYVSYLVDPDEVAYFRHGFTTRQFLKVTEQSLVTVTSPDGQRVLFSPVWNTVDERFETVSIESQICHDIFMDDTGGMTAQSKATTMMAVADGEVLAKTIQQTGVPV